MLFLALTACVFGDAAQTPPSVPAPSQTKPVAPDAPVAPVVNVPTGTPLAALVSTSNVAFRLMDGDLETEWKPHGHYANEGILMRFETPTNVQGVKLHPCGSGAAELQGFTDGVENGRVRFGPEPGVLKIGREVRSIFLKVDRWGEGACLGELEVLGAEIRGPRIVTVNVTASSTLEPAAAYQASYLFDSRLDFGWVEGADGLGIGETVKATWKEPHAVTALEIWNGYQRSPDHFEKNGRATRIAVKAAGKRFEFDVPDTMGSSKLTLPEPVSTADLEIEILAAAKGSRYPDLVLTELRLWDLEGPFSLVAGRAKARAFGTLTQMRGSALERLIDYSLVSHCAPKDRQLKLRSNNSFVYYETSAETETDEVFDGAWVLKGPTGKGSTLQLFGRRHETARDWTPYGDMQETESTRVAGGKPVFTRVSALTKPEFDTIVSRIRKVKGRACVYDYDDLKAKDAVLAEGTAFMDAFVSDPSRG